METKLNFLMRTFEEHLFYESSKKDQEVIFQVIDNFRYLIFDDNVKVQKMAYYAMINIYKNTLKVRLQLIDKKWAQKCLISKWIISSVCAILSHIVHCQSQRAPGWAQRTNMALFSRIEQPHIGATWFRKWRHSNGIH